ncbi:MAG: ferrous iron transport protein B [candidate division KSB1 bacterium]|nr:ferrous iron transport protein B [candidate division KSB1 bacterium]
MRVALAGNPNSGKTTVFNALTGLRQKIANYPGVTIERKSGILTGPDQQTFEIIDLPGIYSLVPKSLDEQIAVDILTGTCPMEPPPDLVVVVADVTNLARNLYLCTQIIDIGLPVVLALNMMDLARKMHLKVNVEGLARRLNIPVVPISAKQMEGLDTLKETLFMFGQKGANGRNGHTILKSVELARVCEPLVEWFQQHGIASPAGAYAEALRVISQPEVLERWQNRNGQSELPALVEKARQELAERGIPWKQAEVRIRYAVIDQICAQNITQPERTGGELSEKIDRVLTHKYFGPVIMFLILATMFQSIYTWAEVPMNAIENGLSLLGQQIERVLPPGPLQDMLVNGVVAGVGAVLVFLPQIVFLFFFLAILEDTGYLARVAFIMDRFMAKIGLSGQSVIPLLSSFACAVPGIMATRTIQNQRDRLITILVAPFMSCSARLPVYTLLIGAFIPGIWFGGIFYLPGLVLLLMYLLGMVAAVVSATILQKFVIKGQTTNFIMELPSYRVPVWRFIFYRVYEAGKAFVTNAGKIILAVSIVLWFLASYPKPDAQHVQEMQGLAKAGQQVDNFHEIRQSYAGRLGQLIEPAIRPLGFDWKIGIGLITSFAAREVIVSTLATIYNLQDVDETSVDLRTALQRDTYPDTGKPVFTPLVALSLMVFFVLACQCMSTLAIVRRETNTWRWPIFMFFYMLLFAYLASFTVFQVGTALGFGS